MPHNFGDNLVTRNAHAHALTNSASYIKRYKNEMRLQKLRLHQPSIGQVVTDGRRAKRGIKNVRPMKTPTFENAYLDRARRTCKNKIMSAENIAETLKRAGFSNTQVRATVNLFQRLEEPYETFAYWLKHGPNEYRRIVNMSLPPMEQIALQTHAQLLKNMYP